MGMRVCAWPRVSVSPDQDWCQGPAPRASVPAASCIMISAGAPWSTTTPTSGATKANTFPTTRNDDIYVCRNPKFPETYTEQSSCQWKITKIAPEICFIRFSKKLFFSPLVFFCLPRFDFDVMSIAAPDSTTSGSIGQCTTDYFQVDLIYHIILYLVTTNSNFLGNQC